jgi:hypothetical protein
VKDLDSSPRTLAEALNEAQRLRASLNTRLLKYQATSRQLRPDFAKAYDDLLAAAGLLAFRLKISPADSALAVEAGYPHAPRPAPG